MTNEACPPGLCAMRANGESLAKMCESLRSQLAAAVARAERAEKLLANEHGLHCAACGAHWMTDAQLDKFSDAVEPYRKRAERAEEENAAWNALLTRASLTPTIWRDGTLLAFDNGTRVTAEGKTPGLAAVSLARQLGLLPDQKGTP